MRYVGLKGKGLPLVISLNNVVSDMLEEIVMLLIFGRFMQLLPFHSHLSLGPFKFRIQGGPSSLVQLMVLCDQITLELITCALQVSELSESLNFLFLFITQMLRHRCILGQTRIRCELYQSISGWGTYKGGLGIVLDLNIVCKCVTPAMAHDHISGVLVQVPFIDISTCMVSLSCTTY